MLFYICSCSEATYLVVGWELQAFEWLMSLSGVFLLLIGLSIINFVADKKCRTFEVSVLIGWLMRFAEDFLRSRMFLMLLNDLRT